MASHPNPQQLVAQAQANGKALAQFVKANPPQAAQQIPALIGGQSGNGVVPSGGQ